MWSIAKSVGAGIVKATVVVATAVAGLFSGSSASNYKLESPLNTQNPVAYRMPYQGQHNAIPSNAIPSNAIPSNAIPSNAIPSNAIPSNAIPSNAIPSNALPASALIMDVHLDRAIPSNAIPSNMVGLKFQRREADLSGPELGDIGSYVCSAKWCDPNRTDYYTFGGVIVDVNGNLLYASGSVWAAEPPAPPPPPAPAPDTVTEDVPPPPPPAPAQSADRCELFEDKNLSYVALDWQPGAPLSLYFKIPGGVPGLEEKVSGDNDPWDYTVEVGSYSGDCRFIQGYSERLYCTVDIPSDYASSLRPMSLQVNGCSTPLYDVTSADIPERAGGGSSSGGGGGGSGGGGGGSGGGGASCGAKPASNDIPASSAWCSCMGGAFSYGPSGCEPPGCTAVCQLPEYGE